MTTKDIVQKFLNRSIDTSRLSSESKRHIDAADKILKSLLKQDLADEQLKEQCDLVIVGALILALVDTDAKYTCVANYYPKDEYAVYKDAFDESITDRLESFKHAFIVVGSRALKEKTLPFTGSFNSTCYPGLDEIFGPDYFKEYDLNTDPATMISPAVLAFSEKLTGLFTDLDDQVNDAKARCEDPYSISVFDELLGDLNAGKDDFIQKISNSGCGGRDLDMYRHSFIGIMTNPDYVDVMNKHRGSYIWRGVMDALAKIEIGVRNLPTLIGLAAFSTTPKDMFFSTKTAVKAEKAIEDVKNLRLN